MSHSDAFAVRPSDERPFRTNNFRCLSDYRRATEASHALQLLFCMDGGETKSLKVFKGPENRIGLHVEFLRYLRHPNTMHFNLSLHEPPLRLRDVSITE